MTPEPSGHCLLSSPEPLSGGINPFLTPVLRLGGVVPKGGDSVWGCQQAPWCSQQPCNRGTLGELGPAGQRQEALTEISSGFISCSRGSPLPFSVTIRRNTNYHPNSVTNMSLSRPAQHSLCPFSIPNLMPTPCQLSQQCQAGTGVTKPVGVCVGGEQEATP